MRSPRSVHNVPHARSGEEDPDRLRRDPRGCPHGRPLPLGRGGHHTRWRTRRVGRRGRGGGLHGLDRRGPAPVAAGWSRYQRPPTRAGGPRATSPRTRTGPPAPFRLHLAGRIRPSGFPPRHRRRVRGSRPPPPARAGRTRLRQVPPGQYPGPTARPTRPRTARARPGPGRLEPRVQRGRGPAHRPDRPPRTPSRHRSALGARTPHAHPPGAGPGGTGRVGPGPTGLATHRPGRDRGLRHPRRPCGPHLSHTRVRRPRTALAPRVARLRPDHARPGRSLRSTPPPRRHRPRPGHHRRRAPVGAGRGAARTPPPRPPRPRVALALGPGPGPRRPPLTGRRTGRTGAGRRTLLPAAPPGPRTPPAGLR